MSLTAIDESGEQFLVERHSGPMAPQLRVSTRELYDAFTRFVDLDVADGRATSDTITAYFDTIQRFLRWCGDNSIHLCAVEQTHVVAYRAHLRDLGFAVTTVALHLSVIRRFYDAAIAYKLLTVNPAKSVKAGFNPVEAEDQVKALSESGLRSLLEVIEGQEIIAIRDRAMVGLMAIHGLRRVEIERLDHESLEGVTWLDSLLQGAPHSGDAETPYLRVHGKRNKFRRIYLRPDTARAWAEYAAAKAARGLITTGAFFVSHGNRSKGRLTRRAINLIVDGYLEAARLKREGVSCHALRHTSGTLAVAGGAKIEHVQSALGHESIDTTMIYVAALEKKANNPANFIGPQLFSD